MMRPLRFRFDGTAPLLMHSEKLADPLSEEKKALSKLTGKRTKTDEDHTEIARIEWLAGLYFDPKLGPFMPSRNVVACFRDGAKLTKRGRDISRAIMCEIDKLPLEYDGPRDRDTMFESRRFVDVRGVVNAGKKVMRCRPIFPEWALDLTVLYDDAVFNPEDLLRIAVDCGRYVGLGDYRPGSPRGGTFGRFEAKLAE